MGPLGAWLLHPGGGVSGKAPGHFIPDLSFSPSLSPLLQSKGEMGRGRHWQSRAQHLVTSPERAVGSRRRSICGRPAEGLAHEAEIKLRLDGQESTSFSEQSSWSVETLERFRNLSPESICLWCWGCTWPFDPHLRVHLRVLSEGCFGHYVSPLS